MAQVSGMAAAAGTVDGAALLGEHLNKPINHVGFGDNGLFRVDSLEGLQRLARVYIAGGYADAFIKSADSVEKAVARVMIAISYGRQIGLSDIQALNSVAVINGRPVLYGDAIVAIVLASGQLEELSEYFEGEGETRVAVCRVKRKGLEPHERRFGAAEKKMAGITNPTYGRYPDRMYQIRARSFALRDRFADYLMGIAIKEEVEDVADQERSAATTALVDRIERAAVEVGADDHAEETAGAASAQEAPPAPAGDATPEQRAFVESLNLG